MGWLGLFNVVLLGVGVWSTLARFPLKNLGLAGLAVALAAIGILTFLGFYEDSSDIRTAIAASFVVLYFAVLASSLNTSVSEKISDGGAKALFDSFTSLVGVVVGFYITGKSVEKATAIVKEGANSPRSESWKESEPHGAATAAVDASAIT